MSFALFCVRSRVCPESFYVFTGVVYVKLVCHGIISTVLELFEIYTIKNIYYHKIVNVSYQ